MWKINIFFHTFSFFSSDWYITFIMFFEFHQILLYSYAFFQNPWAPQEARIDPKTKPKLYFKIWCPRALVNPACLSRTTLKIHLNRPTMILIRAARQINQKTGRIRQSGRNRSETDPTSKNVINHKGKPGIYQKWYKNKKKITNIPKTQGKTWFSHWCPATLPCSEVKVR